MDAPLPNAGSTDAAATSSRTTTTGLRWTRALLSFLIEVVRPGRASASLVGCTVLRSWLIHLCGLVLVGMALLLISGLLDTARQTALAGFPAIGSAVASFILNLLDDSLTELERNPIRIGFAVFGIVAAIEFSFMVAAVVFTAWGALDEPLRQSFRNALRQTWLRTTTPIPVILAVGLVGSVITRADARWRHANPLPFRWPDTPSYPSLQPSDPGYAQAMADYNQQMAEYSAELARLAPRAQAYYDSQPWWIHAEGPLVVLTGAAGALWFVCGLLRAIGRRAGPSRVDRPPMCETCGYNLTGLSPDAQCPECGVSLLSSLGPEVRTGAPWESPGGDRRVAAWRRTTGEAIVAPVAFGRRLRASQGSHDHRSFFWLHQPATLLFGCAGLLANVAVGSGSDQILREPMMSLAIGCVFGCVCVIGAIVVTNAVAIVIGLRQARALGRNLLPVSMQGACYLAAYLLLWEVFGAASACGAQWLAEGVWLQSLETLSGIDRGVVAVVVWIIVNAACGFEFLRLVARITSGARFANR